MAQNESCPFCGQGYVIQVPTGASEEQIREAAIALCACDDALKHKEMLSVRKRIKAIFGDASLNTFADAFGMEVQDDLYQWAEKVYDGVYDKVILQMENGDRAMIVHTGKHIKLSREQKIKREK